MLTRRYSGAKAAARADTTRVAAMECCCCATGGCKGALAGFIKSANEVLEWKREYERNMQFSDTMYEKLTLQMYEFDDRVRHLAPMERVFEVIGVIKRLICDDVVHELHWPQLDAYINKLDETLQWAETGRVAVRVPADGPAIIRRKRTGVQKRRARTADVKEQPAKTHKRPGKMPVTCKWCLAGYDCSLRGIGSDVQKNVTHYT